MTDADQIKLILDSAASVLGFIGKSAETGVMFAGFLNEGRM